MKNFNQINIGDVFTLERKLKNNPHKPTLWRKQSSRTAALASGYKGIIGRPAWFYFSKAETVYPAKRQELEQ
jgi:hypothetical protein